MVKATFVLCVSVFLFSCGVDMAEKAQLAVDSKKADEFVFQNNNDSVYILPSGSSIEIPHDALIDAQGNVVKGDVNISFNEFHTKGEILTSKLPMTYKDSVFESAGMFTINANCEGRPVFIDSKKPIKVNIASDKAGDNFDLYALKDSAWTFVEKAKFKEEVIECLGDGMELQKPFEINDEKTSLKLIDFDVDYSKMPELKDFSEVMWTYAGNSDVDNPDKNEWIYKENWTDTKLERSEQSNTYKVTLERGKKTFVTYLRPVFSNKDKEKAEEKFAEAMKKYEAQKTSLVNKQNRKASTKDIVRSANIFGFGTYNFDAKEGDFFNADIQITLNARLISAQEVYLVLPRSVVTYKLNPKEAFTVQIPKKEINYKVAVAVNDSTLAYIPSTEVKRKLSVGSTHAVLEATLFPKPITHLKSLERFLEEI